MNTDQSRRPMYDLLSTMAQSGDYMDCWALEVALRALSFSDEQIRKALADAGDRQALLAMCVEARTPARQEQRMRHAATARIAAGTR